MLLDLSFFSFGFDYGKIRLEYIAVDHDSKSANNPHQFPVFLLSVVEVQPMY